VAVVAVVADEAAADAADSNYDIGEDAMTRKRWRMTKHTLLMVLLTCYAATISYAAPQTSATTAAAPVQRSFATAQAAVQELIKAAADYDVSDLLQIFGPDGEDFISSADPVRDKNNSAAFAALAQKKNSLSMEPSKPNHAIMVVGDDDWPFPVPLVKRDGQWFFDSQSGRTEILYRRIGANELDAIQVCRGYVEAQKEYALNIHDNSGVNQYAQKIISTPGKQDGLYWQAPDGTAGGPISEGIAKAIQEGYSVDKKSAYHGYYFKILKGQGPAAPLGRIDYVIQGAMIGGFALIAVPAEYRVTGVKTFLVSQDGIVYQKDLGPNSLEIAKKIELYNPDKTWQRTDDQWPADATPGDTLAAE